MDFVFTVSKSIFSCQFWLCHSGKWFPNRGKKNAALKSSYPLLIKEMINKTLQISAVWTKWITLKRLQLCRGVEDRNRTMYWLRKCKMNHYMGKQWKCERWAAVWCEIAEVKACFLVLETIKRCPWVCGQEKWEDDYYGWPACLFYIFPEFVITFLKLWLTGGNLTTGFNVIPEVWKPEHDYL